MGQRLGLVAAYLCVVLAVTFGVWHYAYTRGLDQLAARGQADLALAGDRLVGQLQRYRDLAVLMADHPAIQRALAEKDATGLRTLLQEVADKSAALDVLVLDEAGQALASAFAAGPRALAQKTYVKRALGGALGWGHGPGGALSQRAFFHVAPVFDGQGGVPGVVVVITDLNGIDYNWPGTNPATFFTDRVGEVYVANRSELLVWNRPANAAGLIPPEGAPPPFSVRMVNGHEIWRLGWGPYLPGEGLHLIQDLPVIGMKGEVLLDVTRTRSFARAQTLAVAALFLAFGTLLFFAAERRRALARVNAQLEVRVAERTAALRDTNASLRREAAEREEAQIALRRAQDELVQAGKLSALGQMSAGISHELNQPLMAIRSFAENAVEFLNRDTPKRAADNLSRISDMAQRMGRIIQNLRAFARQENVRQDRVDLVSVMGDALDLTRAHVRKADVALRYDRPLVPIWVRGGEVRLSQVFVNLITNAVDAMALEPEKALTVIIETGDAVKVRFQDTGPGIEMPDKVFDPFYSTKTESGMGLSISYGIVQSFGWQIKGVNRPDGGAEFTVTRELAITEEEAA